MESNRRMTENRYEYNYRIIEKIIEEIEKNHDLRFNQILYNLRIVNSEDTYYIEPKEVYERLINNEIKR